MYILKKAEENDFSLINKLLKKLGGYKDNRFGYYEALDSYNYELEKVFSPRVVRHILFSKDKNWIMVLYNNKIVGLLLIANPNVLLNSTASILLFAGFDKGYEKINCDYSNVFEWLSENSTKISIRANEAGKLILDKYVNAEFELSLPLESNEYYYAIFNQREEPYHE